MLPFSSVQHLQHLYWRAGFGPAAAHQRENPPAYEKVVKNLFQAAKSVKPMEVVRRSDFPGVQDLPAMNADQRRELNRQLRQGMKQLNFAWINRMKEDDVQLREKMTFFWHGHFACRLNNVLMAQAQNNTLRTHALGTFGDLLTAISKDPGMLQFLNNQQNRKGHPNENFAREVLELFTMGRGHYTEQDIQEAARAFTGWGFDREGEFVFRTRAHDAGSKTFLGKRGNFDGDDILRIVLEQRQTAEFITRKIYRYFVNPVENKEVIRTWAQQFFDSGYDIGYLMETIFSSTHFNSEENIGTQIKSPVVFLVGLMRMLDVDFGSEEGPLLVQKVLGQMLLVPPNVAGWPEGRSWIDSGTLMARLKLPQALILSAEYEYGGKENFAMNEDVMQVRDRQFQRKMQAEIHWDSILNATKGRNEKEILETTAGFLLQRPPLHFDLDWLRQHVTGRNHEEQIKMLVMRLVCTPEYQLC
jgi:uncharacterized protein (DUF1800 family)